ncbi:MAG: class I SAM-dependent methyltransferase [Thermoanaerobaculia bacterium]
MRPDADEYAGVDPEAYRRSMWPERESAAIALVGDLLRAGASGPLLDVGCSFGWLLRVASRAGFDAHGIDPSESAVAAARAAGLSVRGGLFPHEDFGRRDWGVITFMDVIEHLPELDATLAAAVSRLRPGGLLAVQVPVSTGAVFAAARTVEAMTGGAVDGPLRRMLQTDFPYPHLHYFSRRSLETLLGRLGLTTVLASEGPIATGHMVDRVSWRARPTLGHRLQAAGLWLAVAGGRAVGRNDLLRLVARRP